MTLALAMVAPDPHCNADERTVGLVLPNAVTQMTADNAAVSWLLGLSDAAVLANNLLRSIRGARIAVIEDHRVDGTQDDARPGASARPIVRASDLLAVERCA
jgi:hypothetical protein